jgi:hypothetical protein
MNVIQKFFDLLPAHWQEYIKEKNWFDLQQFNGCVAVQYEDGSNMLFKYAFAVLDEKRNELAVFTEHCGYFVLSSNYLKWQTFIQYPTEVK